MTKKGNDKEDLAVCFSKKIYRSEDGNLRVVDKIEDGNLVRVLYDHGVRESGFFLEAELQSEPLFYYMRTLKAICLKYKGIDKALLIGGGGMAFCRYFLDINSKHTMTVVEKDNRCVEIAEQWFNISQNERLDVKCMTGEAFISDMAQNNAIQGNEENKILYDMIIFDAFVENKPVKELTTESMLKLSKAILHPEGLLAINVINIKGRAPTMATCLTEQYLKVIFRHVMEIPCENYGNSIILASDREL